MLAHLDLDKQADDCGYIDGEQAVADEAHGLEEHDVAPQQHHVDRQDDGAQRHLSEHQLQHKGPARGGKAAGAGGAKGGE